MNGRNWVVLTALAMEAKAIASELARTPVVEGMGPHVIGIQARRWDSGLLKNAEGIILAGLGGALDSDLAIGDVVVESLNFPLFPSPGTPGEGQGEGLSAAPKNAPHPNPLPAYRERGMRGIRGGRIFTADHLIADVAEKQKLFSETGCLAVDMEGGVIREFAERAGLPMLHIRAVSDLAGEALPEGMADWVDDVGEPRMGKVAAEVAFRPYLIPALMRLQKNSRLALEHLATVVRDVICEVK
jgi:nucleoside phosphorylase